jgi:hypothetical protein
MTHRSTRRRRHATQRRRPRLPRRRALRHPSQSGRGSAAGPKTAGLVPGEPDRPAPAFLVGARPRSSAAGVQARLDHDAPRHPPSEPAREHATPLRRALRADRDEHLVRTVQHNPTSSAARTPSCVSTPPVDIRVSPSAEQQTGSKLLKSASLIYAESSREEPVMPREWSDSASSIPRTGRRDRLQLLVQSLSRPSEE